MPPSGGIPFGKYELFDRIATGGMAEIYRANYLAAAGITKPVVIKKILPAYAGNAGFIQMFMDEARIVVGLSHGNIAQVFDFGEIEGEFYLAMELVHGQALSHILRRALERLGTLPIPFAVFIAMEMCKGLHYAHTRVDAQGAPLKIVHRDVSPQNVLVGYDGQVKLVDFGIARARSAHRDQTEAGAIKGKYVYFAPEQARGGEFDARTDVFAVGTVLYEMLCGRLPFQGKMMDVLSRIVRADFPPPRSIQPALPPALERVLLTAMAKEKENRYPSAQAMQEALAEYLYAHAPTFSNAALAQMMSWLFDREAAADGGAVPLLPSFLQQVPGWKKARGQVPPRSRPVPTIRPPPPADDEPTPTAERVTVAEPPRRPPAVAPPMASRPRRSPVPVPAPVAEESPAPFDTADTYRKVGHPRTTKLLLAVVPLLAAALAAAGVFAWGNFTSYSVRVQSRPPGAQVIVDGVPSGQVTPVLIKGLSAEAPHLIELSLPGMKPWRQSLPPARGVTVPLDATLEREVAPDAFAAPTTEPTHSSGARPLAGQQRLDPRRVGLLIPPSKAARIRLEPSRRYRVWAESPDTAPEVFFLAQSIQGDQGPYPTVGSAGRGAKDAPVVTGAMALYAFVLQNPAPSKASDRAAVTTRLRLQAEGASEISTLLVEPHRHSLKLADAERLTIAPLDPALGYDVSWRSEGHRSVPGRLVLLQERPDGTLQPQLVESGRPVRLSGAQRLHVTILDDALEDNEGELLIDLVPQARADDGVP